jgi:hypothetical protein
MCRFGNLSLQSKLPSSRWQSRKVVINFHSTTSVQVLVLGCWRESINEICWTKNFVGDRCASFTHFKNICKYLFSSWCYDDGRTSTLWLVYFIVFIIGLGSMFNILMFIGLGSMFNILIFCCFYYWFRFLIG